MMEDIYMLQLPFSGRHMQCFTLKLWLRSHGWPTAAGCLIGPGPYACWQGSWGLACLAFVGNEGRLFLSLRQQYADLFTYDAAMPSAQQDYLRILYYVMNSFYTK